MYSSHINTLKYIQNNWLGNRDGENAFVAGMLIKETDIDSYQNKVCF